MLLWMTIAFCWLTVGLACDCMPHREDNYCRSDVVFRGEAVAEFLGETSEPYPWEIRIYTVNVEEIFWSNSSFVGMTTFNLTTQRSSAMCGVRFSLNTAYVIAASERNGQLWTHLCAGNTDWNSLDTKQKRFFTRRLRNLCA